MTATRVLPGPRVAVGEGSESERFVIAPSQPARGVLVVRLRGELDLMTVPRTRRVLGAAVDAVAAETAPRTAGGRGAPGRVFCDLDEVVFLAVSALDMLADLVLSARARRVEFALVASCRPVTRVLELCDLDHFFVVLPRADAVPASQWGSLHER